MVNNPLKIQDLVYLYVYPQKYMISLPFFFIFANIRFPDREIRIFMTKGLGVPPKFLQFS